MIRLKLRINVDALTYPILSETMAILRLVSRSQKTFLPLFALVFTVYKRFKIGNSKKGDFINRLSTFIKCL